MKETVTLPAYLFPSASSAPIATVERWEKALGAAVLAGEPLALLRTGDITFLVPSPTFGVLSKRCVLPNEAIEAGEPLAVLTGVSASIAGIVAESPPTSPAAATRLPARDQATMYAVTLADISEALRLIGRVVRGETVSGASEHLSLLPFVVSAVAANLVKCPDLNRHPTAINIGVEVRDTVGDAWTPVLTGAHRSSVLALSREWARLHAKVVSGSLTENDIAGSTFLVSESPNVLYRTPRLHQPFAGHLCFGKPVGEQLYLCLAYEAEMVREDIAEAFLADVAEGLASASFLFS